MINKLLTVSLSGICVFSTVQAVFAEDKAEDKAGNAATTDARTIKEFGIDFKLAYFNPINDRQLIMEYIPVDEDFSTWTRMIAIRHHADPELTIDNLVNNIANNITTRHANGDSLASGEIFRKDGIIAYDFTLSDGVGQPMTIIEHNTQWFLTTGKGVLHYQIAERHYINADHAQGQSQTADQFLQLKAERQKNNLTIAAAGTLPVPHGYAVQRSVAE